MNWMKKALSGSSQSGDSSDHELPALITMQGDWTEKILARDNRKPPKLFAPNDIQSIYDRSKPIIPSESSSSN